MDDTIDTMNLMTESEINNERNARGKPNLMYAKIVGYAIPLVVTAIAIFWV